MDFDRYWEINKKDILIQALKDKVDYFEKRCQNLQDENYTLQRQLDERE